MSKSEYGLKKGQKKRGKLVFDTSKIFFTKTHWTASANISTTFTNVSIKVSLFMYYFNILNISHTKIVKVFTGNIELGNSFTHLFCILDSKYNIKAGKHIVPTIHHPVLGQTWLHKEELPLDLKIDKIENYM